MYQIENLEELCNIMSEVEPRTLESIDSRGGYIIPQKENRAEDDNIDIFEACLYANVTRNRGNE